MRPSSTVVLDASAIVEALLSPDVTAQLRATVGNSTSIAPEIVDVEVMSGLRRALRQGSTTEIGARHAIDDFLAFPLERVAHRAFLRASWELRHNLSAADALYVVVARAFAAPLVTSDRRLAAAPNLGVAVTVLPG